MIMCEERKADTGTEGANKFLKNCFIKGNRGGRGPNRPGDKRRMDQNQSGAKRSRPSNQGRKTGMTGAVCRVKH